MQKSPEFLNKSEQALHCQTNEYEIISKSMALILKCNENDVKYTTCMS